MIVLKHWPRASNTGSGQSWWMLHVNIFFYWHGPGPIKKKGSRVIKMREPLKVKCWTLRVLEVWQDHSISFGNSRVYCRLEPGVMVKLLQLLLDLLTRFIWFTLPGFERFVKDMRAQKVRMDMVTRIPITRMMTKRLKFVDMDWGCSAFYGSEFMDHSTVKFWLNIIHPKINKM